MTVMYVLLDTAGLYGTVSMEQLILQNFVLLQRKYEIIPLRVTDKNQYWGRRHTVVVSIISV
jgi:hypothetical protein